MAGKKKILIVDDDRDFRELLKAVLQEDYEILHAFDGQEGLDLAVKEKPDAILLDVMMPKVAGIEMLRSLQSDLETRRIPVIILTASHFDPTTQLMFEQEPNVRAFLQKPCDMEDLRKRIEGSLAGS